MTLDLNKTGTSSDIVRFRTIVLSWTCVRLSVYLSVRPDKKHFFLNDFYITIEKIKLENSWNICVSKCCPWAKTCQGQAMVIYPLGHGHFTKNDKIPFFTKFDARYLLVNFKIVLELFWRALDLRYRMKSLYNISSRFSRG